MRALTLERKTDYFITTRCYGSSQYHHIYITFDVEGHRRTVLWKVEVCGERPWEDSDAR